MADLNGKTIGIAAERNAQVIARLVKKNLGRPITYSIQGKRIFDEDKSIKDVKKLMDGEFNRVILTTKIGVEYLEDAAKKLGELDRFKYTLNNCSLAIRGGKALNWVKIHNLTADYVTEDGSMDSLLKILALETVGIEKRLFFQSFDLNDGAILSQLVKLGYEVYLSKPYYYEPADENTLASLRSAILKNKVDAVIFTSKKQVDNLFTTYHPEEQKALVDSFNQHVLSVGIGKVTAEHLKRFGVKDVFYPENQKTGTMISSLGRYLAVGRNSASI